MMGPSSLASFSRPYTSSHLRLLLLPPPPLPAPHSKFSLRSFTIRSVRSLPACRAQRSMDATVTHSLLNLDAVGGRRLHFKFCSIKKKNKNKKIKKNNCQIRVALLLFLLLAVHANVFCRLNRKLNLSDFRDETVCDTLWVRTRKQHLGGTRVLMQAGRLLILITESTADAAALIPSSSNDSGRWSKAAHGSLYKR